MYKIYSPNNSCSLLLDLSEEVCSLFVPMTGYSYTAPRMRSEGSSDCSWTGIYIVSAKNFFFKTHKILTFRSPFQHRKASFRI